MADERGGGRREPARSPLLEHAQRIANMFMPAGKPPREKDNKLEAESKERDFQKKELMSSGTRREIPWTSDTAQRASSRPKELREESSRTSSPSARLAARIAESLAKVGERASHVAAAAVGCVIDAATHGLPFAPSDSDKDKDQENSDSTSAHTYSDFLYERSSKTPRDDQSIVDSDEENAESDKHFLKRTTTTYDTAVKRSTLPDLIPRSTVSTPLDINTELEEQSKTSKKNDEDSQLKQKTPPKDENNPFSKFRIMLNRIPTISDIPQSDENQSDSKSMSSPHDPEESRENSSSSADDPKDPRTKFQESLSDETGTRPRSRKSQRKLQNAGHSEESPHTSNTFSKHYKDIDTEYRESQNDEISSKNKSSENESKDSLPNSDPSPMNPEIIIAKILKSKDEEKGTRSKEMAFPAHIGIITVQDKSGIIEPDDEQNNQEESSPTPSDPQNQSRVKNIIVPVPKQSAVDEDSDSMNEPDDVSEDKSVVHGSKPLSNEKKDEKTAESAPKEAAVVVAPGGSGPMLVPLSGRDSSGKFSDTCECVELLRKYVNPPRVFIKDLGDYGEDEDQFIARRDCSDFSKRYLRCKNFWVSTCQPPKGNPPKKAIEQWEATCPPPPRRSVQQCIRDKEAHHEEMRKQVLAQKKDKNAHIPTAAPRLCRSIYDDDCVPPSKLKKT